MAIEAQKKFQLPSLAISEIDMFDRRFWKQLWDRVKSLEDQPDWMRKLFSILSEEWCNVSKMTICIPSLYWSVWTMLISFENHWLGSIVSKHEFFHTDFFGLNFIFKFSSAKYTLIQKNETKMQMTQKIKKLKAESRKNERIKRLDRKLKGRWITRTLSCLTCFNLSQLNRNRF